MSWGSLVYGSQISGDWLRVSRAARPDMVVPIAGTMVTPARQAALPSARQARRIGIDVGDVLMRHWHWGATLGPALEIPGAFAGMRELIRIFGADNTYIVIKIRAGGPMHRRVEELLHSICNFCSVTGFRRHNIHFVPTISGTEGKGVAAVRLGVSPLRGRQGPHSLGVGAGA